MFLRYIILWEFWDKWYTTYLECRGVKTAADYVGWYIHISNFVSSRFARTSTVSSVKNNNFNQVLLSRFGICNNGHFCNTSSKYTLQCAMMSLLFLRFNVNKDSTSETTAKWYVLLPKYKCWWLNFLYAQKYYCSKNY